MFLHPSMRIPSIRHQIQIWMSKATHGLMLLRNHHVKRHIVVFESDDWGSIRMPSLDALQRLQERGVKIALPQSYDSLDTLASNDDLELLMEALSSVKDSNGNPAKITLNCCVANPDFVKIRENGFKEYYYEPFTETLKKYPHHDRSFALWKEGMEHGVFRPQFHGREHLNPQKWLRFLQEGDNNMMTAFEEGCYSAGVTKSGSTEYVLETYKIETAEECGIAQKSVTEGLELFKELFGFSSETMIAPCYTWDDYIEETATDLGVKCFQSSYIQKHSPWQRKLGRRITGHYFGEQNRRGQCYTVRNCSFEPSQLAYENADSCFADICKAFAWHLPAVVSCHRLNFIGDLKPKNRDNNLREFRRLLKMIMGKYSDVEFMSSDELGRVLLRL